eukprot:5067436-Prymnesium_polylepis.1
MRWTGRVGRMVRALQVVRYGWCSGCASTASHSVRRVRRAPPLRAIKQSAMHLNGMPCNQGNQARATVGSDLVT